MLGHTTISYSSLMLARVSEFRLSALIGRSRTRQVWTDIVHLNTSFEANSAPFAPFLKACTFESFGTSQLEAVT